MRKCIAKHPGGDGIRTILPQPPVSMLHASPDPEPEQLVLDEDIRDYDRHIE